jgi:1-acyl-sn-glycerol-3-phosphate acyltransferase
MGTGEARPAANDDEALQMVACGRPLPRHQVRIVDAQGGELPPRHVGRLEFRGPSATRGYYRNAEATALLMHDGWLDSGDLAYLADGDIYIAGRLKDMIIRGGRNLYPYELEEAVGGLPGVRRGCVAVFGTAVPGLGTEKLVVVAESREADAEARRELVRRIDALTVELLGSPPDDVVLAAPNSVLKTSSGKIRRAATRDAYCRDGFGRRARAPWRQMLRLAAAGVWRRLGSLGGMLYGVYAWGIVGVLAVPLVAIALVVPGFALRWRCCAALVRTALRLCGISLQVDGLERARPGPRVFVANHASYIDGLVVMAALPFPVAFVAKAELAGHALAGPLLRRFGVVFVERFDVRQGVDDVRRLAAVATARPLFFFAEGTFTRQSGLRTFRLGAFQIAAQNGLSVTPVALAGTRDVLRDESWLPKHGGVRVNIAEGVAVEGDDWAAALRLRDVARASILKDCGEADLDGEGA